MRRTVPTLLTLLTFALFTPALRAEQTSALIAQAMDKQLPKNEIHFDGTLPQAITDFGDMTGVRIEADDAVYDILPWGDLTNFRADFRHQTLRQALAAICQKLGLQYELQDASVQLHLLPPLQRLGRRATVQELQCIDFLAGAELDAKQTDFSAERLLAAIDARLEKSPYAVENRAFIPADPTPVNVSRHASLLDAMEEIAAQTNATWYPWGETIVVLKKSDQIRLELSRRITVRYDGQDVGNVLLDLAHRGGLDFQIQPGALQKIPTEFRTLRLELDNATVQQALESIAGFTGLGYTVTDGGVSIWSAPASATASTQNN
jgi:hypothetical protein